MTEKTPDFVCFVRKIRCFFAGKGYAGRLGDVQPSGLCKAEGRFAKQIAPVILGAKAMGKPISIPRTLCGWCVWCPSGGCRMTSTALGPAPFVCVKFQPLTPPLWSSFCRRDPPRPARPCAGSPFLPAARPGTRCWCTGPPSAWRRNRQRWR